MDSFIPIPLEAILRRRNVVPSMTGKTTPNCHMKITAELLEGVNTLQREAYQLEEDAVCLYTGLLSTSSV